MKKSLLLLIVAGMISFTLFSCSTSVDVDSLAEDQSGRVTAVVQLPDGRYVTKTFDWEYGELHINTPVALAIVVDKNEYADWEVVKKIEGNDDYTIIQTYDATILRIRRYEEELRKN